MLMKAKGKGKNKINNIVNILNNIELSIFEGVYLHHSDEPSKSEESIAGRTKLRIQKFDEIIKKEKIIV